MRAVLIVDAKVLVPQHFQNTALCDPALSTLRDHAFELRLEHVQASNLMFHLLQLPKCDAVWRYDYNHVRPHSSLGNQTPAKARRALEQFDGTAPGALAAPEKRMPRRHQQQKQKQKL